MSGRYLTELADWLRAAGLAVVEYDGWQTRARSSGGYADGRPWGVMWHHTASQASPENDAFYCAEGNPDAPVCNLLAVRDGTIWIIAAGASNTNGKGGPYTWSRGTVPHDAMNTYAVSIEISNSGVGEPYPAAQIEACFAASLAVLDHCGLAVGDVCQHFDWCQPSCPGRKIDPARAEAVEGAWQPRSVNSAGTWSIADLLAEHEARQAPPPPQPPEEDDMLRKVLVPKFDGAGWWPWLALFDSGVIRPLANGDQAPADGQTELTDIAQYKRLCHWAGIQLVEEQPS